MERQGESNTPAGTPLVEVRNLRKEFGGRGTSMFRKGHTVAAVDDVSFDIRSGETLGVVGESGSGKSTTGYCLLQLIPPTAGSVKYQGVELTGLNWKAMRKYRRDLQIIFQNPYASLNGRRTIEDIVSEGMVIHKIGTRASRLAETERLLERVGISASQMERRPAEFSGGQRQRIVIARALSLQPSFIVCDEPVSALDVSVQAQILNLLKDLQEELGLTLLFIAHDLSVVRMMSDRIIVMKSGKIVEAGEAAAVYEAPQHEYTQSLLDAVLVPELHRQSRDRPAARAETQ
jgi:ABC-type oligopeptide transport system ATPase subunit